MPLLFSCQVLINSLKPNGLQHARLLCPPPSPQFCPDSLSRWCYLTISSSATLFSLCCQSFLASGSFPMIFLFASVGQIRASASALDLPANIQYWFPLGLTDFDLLAVQGTLKSLFQHHQFFGVQSPLWSNSHIRTWLLEKNIALSIWTFEGKTMSLILNTMI